MVRVQSLGLVWSLPSLPDRPPAISKDTQLCISLAGRPGNFGTRFHNFLYRALALDYLDKAFSTHDLPGATPGVRALGIRGCAVSMPFREACSPLLDALEDSADQSIPSYIRRAC